MSVVKDVEMCSLIDVEVVEADGRGEGVSCGSSVPVVESVWVFDLRDRECVDGGVCAVVGSDGARWHPTCKMKQHFPHFRNVGTAEQL